MIIACNVGASRDDKGCREYGRDAVRCPCSAPIEEGFQARFVCIVGRDMPKISVAQIGKVGMSTLDLA